MLKTYRFWIVLFSVISAVSLGTIIFQNRKSGEKVLIYHKDELVYEMDLNNDEVKQFAFDEGINVVEVKDSKVFVKSADCKNQICVKSKPIDAAGSVIVCAPHSFTVKVSGDSEEDVYI